MKKILASQEELGIYLSCLEDTLAYNLPMLLSVDQVGAAKVESSLQKLLSLHKQWNTRFALDEDGALVKYIADEPLVFSSSQVKAVDKDNLVRLFTLLDAPLYRFEFFQTPEGNYLFADFHHIIMDGFSLNRFFHDFYSLLEGKEVAGEKFTCFEDAQRKASYRADAAMREQDKTYFADNFGSIDLDSSPTQDKDDGAVAYKKIRIPLAKLSDKEVSDFIKGESVRRSSLFYGAFAMTLGQFSFADEACFLSVNNGRDADTKESYGMFVRTFPIYAKGFGVGEVTTLLHEIDDSFKQTIGKKAYGYGDLVQDFSFSNDILFSYQGDYYYAAEFAGKKRQIEVLPVKDGKEKFAFELFRDGESYFVDAEFRSDLYEEDSVRHLMSCFEHFALELMRKENLAEIAPTSAEDLAIVSSFNNTDISEYDFESDFVDDIRKSIAERPDHPAIVVGEKKLTYHELDVQAKKLKDYLLQQGYPAQSVISILINRNEFMGICPVGVLFAGYAYQPLDPSYPDERLSFMIEDASAKLLICDRGLEKRIPSYKGPILYTDEIASLPSLGLEAPKANPHDLYIMLYTSGSTGKPKGVQLERHNLSIFVQYQRKLYKPTPEDRCSLYPSFGFDACMYDLYGALCNGLTIYVIDEEMRLDLHRLNQYFTENKITISFMTTQVARQFVEYEDNQSLRILMTGGEKLVPINPPRYAFYNGYGPTECTIIITAQRVDKLYYRVPIGKGLPFTHLYILDKNMRPLPYGVPGFLYAAGPQVGRGYLNRPEENAKAFIKNPLEGGVYEKMYSTGDVVRFLKDGTLDFIGRKDGQVKIRGFRIEMGEVERVIREFPGVKDATVNAFPGASGGMYLAGYVVGDSELDLEAIKAFILDRKPYYMVPEAMMQLESIPLNQNGKVNRRALPIPSHNESKKDVVAPRNEKEEAIRKIAAKILGYEEVSVTEDLFFAGLTSISSIRFMSLLSSNCGIDLSTKQLRDNPTIEKLALLGKEEQENEEELDSYPLTKTQEGIFVEMMAHPSSTIYNIPILYRLDPRVDLDKLEASVKKAIDLHASIKGHLVMEGVDVRVVPSKEEAKVSRIKGALPEPFKLTPYDLFKGPFYQAAIYESKEGNAFFLDTHHIASDGSSLAVLLEDIETFYNGLEAPKEKRNAFQIALKEQRDATKEELARQKEYYASFLQGVDSPSLPKKDYELSASDAPKTFDYDLGLDAGKLASFLKSAHVGPNAFFNAVFAYALGKWNGNEDALFTSIYSGRDDVSVARTVTMLVKTLPVYVSFEGNKSRLALLQEMEAQLQKSQESTLYSFADISHDFDVKADVMFAYQGDGFIPEKIGNLPAKMQLFLSDEAKAPFSVDCLLKGDRYQLHFEYMPSLFQEETMRYFSRLYDLLAQEMMVEGSLDSLPLIDEASAKEMDEYNKTDDPKEGEDYFDLLKKHVLAHPEKEMVIGIDETLTYDEFDARTNAVANELLRLGVQKDERVVTLTRRIANAYVAREGVLKAGAAFLPIDPAYPDDRVTYIIEDSEARFVLTTKDIYEERKTRYPNVTFLLIEDLLAKGDKKAPEVSYDPKSLAYCIYTSGSTGKPKGVMIERHNLHNLVCYSDHNYVAHEYVDNAKVTVALASLSFDLSIQEEFMPYAHGMTTLIASEDEILNPALLSKRMIAHKVDILTTTPSYVNNCLDVEEVMKAFRLLRVIDLGAEAIPASLVEKMRKKGMNCLINNGYGPTEATVVCTMDAVTSSRITIGFPLNNVKTYIVDKQGRRLMFGCVGELLIAGDGVARGYIHRDDLNKEKFIPFLGDPAYRSGDLARINYDGRIEFFGRKDNQVKLRGLRVELDEIENAFLTYPGISSAVVLVKESSEEGQFLVGYYLSKEEIAPAELKAHLAKTLTPYMIPKVFVHLDVLPMTNNGKVDKKALPEPTFTHEKAKLRLPQNPTQQAIYDIFSHVLGIKDLSIDDDFFDMGGTSLSASKVAMLAMEKGLPISYGDIFDYPTVIGLAALSGAQPAQAAASEAAEEVEIDEGLIHNQVADVDGIVKDKDFKRILLTGATGFLGVHVLETILREGKQEVVALVRGNKTLSGKERLLGMLAYYFDDPREEDVKKRVTVIESDVTSTSLVDDLKDENFDLIINCAALVKHFAADDSIERVNLGGVKNLIEVALAHSCRLVQISTLSVAGENVGGKFPKEKRIHESEIFFGQDVSNKYVNSKIKAEQALIDAVKTRGLDGKVVRVGNLMGRAKDGEFQANSSTNNFMNSLRAYVKLGVFPVSAADSTIDFSPIDEVARSVLLLAATPKQYTIFHSANSHEVELGDVIEALNDFGYPIAIVSDEEFGKKLSEFMQDEEKNMAVSSLISYDSSSMVTREYILSDNTFTIKALYRLGYKWPITDKNYLAASIASLATLGFFE